MQTLKKLTAPNLNKTIIYISAFLLTSRHFEFQISSTQRKFLDFLQKHFFHWKVFFKMIFFSMGITKCFHTSILDFIKRGRSSCANFHSYTSLKFSFFWKIWFFMIFFNLSKYELFWRIHTWKLYFQNLQILNVFSHILFIIWK